MAWKSVIEDVRRRQGKQRGDDTETESGVSQDIIFLFNC